MPKLPLIDPENPPRTKTKAAAGGTAGATVLTFLLTRVFKLDLNDVPPEVLVFASGSLATLAAYLKRDGLRGAWQRVVNGQGDA